MSAYIIVGTQWGDEGKGKLVDALALRSSGVVRFQGGANAGHTLCVGGEKTILHLIPSGVLHRSVDCFIASGVALDPMALVSEIEALKSKGYLNRREQLKISQGSLLVLPFHKQLDRAREMYLGEGKIGTTQRGIGPSYEDRASRSSLLLADIYSKDLKHKLSCVLEEKNFLLEKLYAQSPIRVEEIYEQLVRASEALQPYICEDMSGHIHEMLEKGQKLLFEGAQGVLLDNIHGSFPFVTSSNTVAAMACVSVGLGFKPIKGVFGVTKAYCTRVGAGPFPTEDLGPNGEILQEQGHEFGSTTCRRRRCGWLDLVALRHAIQVGGVEELFLTKLDVLSHLDIIKVCNAYDINGNQYKRLSPMSAGMGRIRPVYQEFKSWGPSLSGQERTWSELPLKAREYVDFIQRETGLRVSVISVGPGREETIYRDPIMGGKELDF